MGSAGLQNPNRQMGGNVSFAQSLSGSQPATPLDLSEFPSLSNNAQMAGSSQGSMWSGTSNTGSRNITAPVQRNQGTPLSSQVGQDDMFSPPSSRVASTQGGFRFGGHGSAQAASQQGQSGGPDEFPPLNRGENGELGSDRLSAMGFGSHDGPPSGTAGPSSRGNGLLNALSATNPTSEVRSPPGMGMPGLSRSHDEERAGNVPEGSGASSEAKDTKAFDAPAPIDPLNGMSEADKWGIKGLRTLMNNYPDYHAMVVGLDPASLGLDVTSPEPISTQVYSLFDEAPPRPTVNGAKPRLPDCYNVTNVQPIETKIQGFNEETLFWIFYSCPQDIKQQMAAEQLNNRNWRWHKKHQIWLTKDEQMTPQILSPTHERGYYIVWDTNNWRKDRKEFTLYYNDLDTSLTQASGP